MFSSIPSTVSLPTHSSASERLVAPRCTKCESRFNSERVPELFREPDIVTVACHVRTRRVEPSDRITIENECRDIEPGNGHLVCLVSDQASSNQRKMLSH